MLLARKTKIFALFTLGAMLLDLSGEVANSTTILRTKKTITKTETPITRVVTKGDPSKFEVEKKSDTHNDYYKGLTAEQSAQADAIAKSIAQSIMSNKKLNTDLKRVRAASEKVHEYCMKSTYGADEKRYYRSPYGVFVTKNYTCAGAARALGRVLDFMGYKWTHINPNLWKHQWCELNMDGKKGYADATTGFANYGDYGE